MTRRRIFEIWKILFFDKDGRFIYGVARGFIKPKEGIPAYIKEYVRLNPGEEVARWRAFFIGSDARWVDYPENAF